MAVEARYNMNLFPSHQFVLNNRDFMKLNPEAANMTPNYYAPISNNLINNNNNYVARETLSPGLIYPQNSMNNTTTFSKQAESGLTQTAINPPRKRSRDDYQSDDIITNRHHHSLLDNDIAFQILHHQSEIDRFVAQHAEKVRLEVEKQRKREARMVVSAIEEGIAKRLREKDEEIVRVGKLNWALQERVRTLCVENQLWKDLAQSNEATAMTLRTNLESILLAHVSPAGAGRDRNDNAVAVDEDAESCCGENDAVEDSARRCRGCGEEEARVLVLPCRHLCLCTACGSTVRACPVCHAVMTASVRVNFS